MSTLTAVISHKFSPAHHCDGGADYMSPGNVSFLRIELIFDFYVRKNQNFLIFPHIKVIFC